MLQVYRPVIEAVSQRLQVDFHVTDSIFGAQQSEATVAAIKSYIESEIIYSLRADGVARSILIFGPAVDGLCGLAKRCACRPLKVGACRNGRSQCCL